MAAATTEVVAAAVDWDAVREAGQALGALSAQVARVELGGLGDKIAAEKRKLRGLAAKHAQACDELARVRRGAQKERERLLEAHDRLEANLANLNARPNKDLAEANQLSVELAQARKKLEAKSAEHDKYLDQHLQTMRKRERMVVVQGKTIRNLLHRKLALGERVHLSGREREECDAGPPEPMGGPASKAERPSGVQPAPKKGQAKRPKKRRG